MNVLLDTHALIWFAEDDPRISPAATMAIEQAENTVFVSMASLWEIAIKTSIGKLSMNIPFPLLQEMIQQYGFDLLPIVFDDMIEYTRLPLVHRDPFDRLLVAQSRRLQYAIVSRETIFDELGATRIW